MDVTDWSYINSREKKLNSGKNWYDLCIITSTRSIGATPIRLWLPFPCQLFLQSVYVTFDQCGQEMSKSISNLLMFVCGKGCKSKF